MRRVLIAMALAGVLAMALWLAYTGSRPAPASSANGVSVASALTGSEGGAGYRRVETIRNFRFPADQGPHPGFRNEWWYWTGNLETASGRRFGYELTVFRIALSPTPPASASGWATNQLYTAHLALTDPEAGTFRFFERWSRGALGLAGARAAPFRVWLEDWSVSSVDGGFPWRLAAAADDVSLELELSPAKPRVLQGERGLDRKSAAGDASYYYSYTRLETTGTLRARGEAHAVAGLSWLDREWSSSALGKRQAGWDWFALQFDDGADLMYYRLRRHDGSTDSHSGGAWVAPDGAKTALQAGDVRLEPLAYWQSPRGGRYPVRWRLRLPTRGCSLSVTPVLDDQELAVSVRYWEGAVNVAGECGQEQVTGRGYVELVGYAHTGH